MTAPVRVMLVEDSLVVRQLLAHIVSRDPRLALVAAVPSGEEALREIHRVQPDVISMDIRLPGIDGLETTRRIMAERPTPIVVIADAVEDSSLKISMNALRAGALSVVEKPVGTGHRAYAAVADEICTQLRIMSEVPVIRRRPIGAERERPPLFDPPARPDAVGAPPGLVAVAASTGGPPAFARLLGALPAAFPAPILLVQHMGAAFMDGFAAWLNGVVPLAVEIAAEGVRPLPGHVYVAPGDRHLEFGPGGLIALSDDPPIGGQRPSATALFRSLARHAGSRALGILLTGMGEDGAAGLLDMRRAGALTIAEHETSAVVYGMPAAAVRLRAASAVLPLDMIAPRILRAVQPGAAR
ncbi:response regulator receiver modulated CheB methylesterase [Methylobacterium sp. 4-46]|uniref:chemotaxis-specific protein-glutamate methyltransferase CheB n=1 Tax=unclassified Methylobacterium TaxID=2615210 RepID=UPI000152CF00|nr:MULTISPECIES: chemotaxis-specific protein-glutamate methyltransferase CheB [Methylobacterium]ACA14816.1 response regulator receiver modulated CheB methylesterase [Methylobacterium sp. 4-46]WFT80561.1 chemotaxis-specific protein-glutamate methyltransferase CheB [Methylobacterium nodulans]